MRRHVPREATILHAVSPQQSSCEKLEQDGADEIKHVLRGTRWDLKDVKDQGFLLRLEHAHKSNSRVNLAVEH